VPLWCWSSWAFWPPLPPQSSWPASQPLGHPHLTFVISAPLLLYHWARAESINWPRRALPAPKRVCVWGPLSASAAAEAHRAGPFVCVSPRAEGAQHSKLCQRAAGRATKYGFWGRTVHSVVALRDGNKDASQPARVPWRLVGGRSANSGTRQVELGAHGTVCL